MAALGLALHLPICPCNAGRGLWQYLKPANLCKEIGPQIGRVQAMNQKSEARQDAPLRKSTRNCVHWSNK